MSWILNMHLVLATDQVHVEVLLLLTDQGGVGLVLLDDRVAHIFHLNGGLALVEVLVDLPALHAQVLVLLLVVDAHDVPRVNVLVQQLHPQVHVVRSQVRLHHEFRVRLRPVQLDPVVQQLRHLRVLNALMCVRWG